MAEKGKLEEERLEKSVGRYLCIIGTLVCHQVGYR